MMAMTSHTSRYVESGIRIRMRWPTSLPTASTVPEVRVQRSVLRWTRTSAKGSDPWLEPPRRMLLEGCTGSKRCWAVTLLLMEVWWSAAAKLVRRVISIMSGHSSLSDTEERGGDILPQMLRAAELPGMPCWRCSLDIRSSLTDFSCSLTPLSARSCACMAASTGMATVNSFVSLGSFESEPKLLCSISTLALPTVFKKLLLLPVVFMLTAWSTKRLFMLWSMAWARRCCCSRSSLTLASDCGTSFSAKSCASMRCRFAASDMGPTVGAENRPRPRPRA
mmetsp:Transcript_33307/g.105503  ORF Transcript_33307/g.105503 Transcript_33307/m.105503 type:complete len:279 (+) Transcript_33307:1579-2415(+)